MHREPDDSYPLGFTQDPDTGSMRLVFSDGRILPMRFEEMLSVIRTVRTCARWWLLKGAGSRDPWVVENGLENVLWSFDHPTPESERVDHWKEKA